MTFQHDDISLEQHDCCIVKCWDYGTRTVMSLMVMMTQCCQ